LDRTSAGEMPSGRIDQKRHVRTRHDLRRDLGEIEIHRPGVAPRHDERCLCRLGRDRAEEAVRRSLGPKDEFPPLVKDKSNEDVEVFALRAEFEHLTAATNAVCVPARRLGLRPRPHFLKRLRAALSDKAAFKPPFFDVRGHDPGYCATMSGGQ
jgi:hypothetical protein